MISEKGKKFIIDTSILLLKELHSEIECRRQILNFMNQIDFTDQDFEYIESTIEKEKSKWVVND